MKKQPEARSNAGFYKVFRNTARSPTWVSLGKPCGTLHDQRKPRDERSTPDRAGADPGPLLTTPPAPDLRTLTPIHAVSSAAPLNPVRPDTRQPTLSPELHRAMNAALATTNRT